MSKYDQPPAAGEAQRISPQDGISPCTSRSRRRPSSVLLKVSQTGQSCWTEPGDRTGNSKGGPDWLSPAKTPSCCEEVELNDDQLALLRIGKSSRLPPSDSQGYLYLLLRTALLATLIGPVLVLLIH